jgi:DNA-binding response OmpR family regulator
MLATETTKQILIVDRDVAASNRCARDSAKQVSWCARSPTARRRRGGGGASAASGDHRLEHARASALDLIQGCARTRSASDRLIILSALSGEQDVVTGLDLGADDYIAKPFSLREVVARVCAVLRSRHRDTQRLVAELRRLVLDASDQSRDRARQLVNLRGIEYRLLEFLMSNPGRTFNRTQLLAQVWGDDSEVDERTVDVNVQRLRKILSEPGYEAYIQTVRGFGYRFAPRRYAPTLSPSLRT